MAPKDTSFKRWSCKRRLQTAVQIVSKPPAPSNGGPIFPFWQAGLIKAGDVVTDPGSTTTNKQVWICDICHKQIHGRK